MAFKWILAHNANCLSKAVDAEHKEIWKEEQYIKRRTQELSLIKRE